MGEVSSRQSVQLPTSGSVRNELKVDAGCSKVHASAWKDLRSANFFEIKQWLHGVARLQSIPRVSHVSHASPDVFSLVTGRFPNKTFPRWVTTPKEPFPDMNMITQTKLKALNFPNWLNWLE